LGGEACRGAAQPGVDVARRLLAVAHGHRHVALGRHHVAAGEQARVAGHHRGGVDLHHAVLHLQAGHAVEQRQVHVLAQRQHQRVGLQRLELAGGLRVALFVEHHLLDGQFTAFAGLLDGGQPLDHHAFLQRFFDLEVVRGHLLARAAVDDDGLGGAQALGGARHVDGGVAAAVDHHAAAQQRLVFAFHAAQHRTASTMRELSLAGMKARLAMCAPTARKVAS
jgi:hypothetical protein